MNLVEGHYHRGSIFQTILTALEQTGKNLEELKPADLAPVDEFHTRGREATIELASKVRLQAGQDLLDVGCGLGGSARYLASEFGVHVTGIDLTQEFIDIARELAKMVGLQDGVAFEKASATELPFADNSFDVAWTEHVQMNIQDKARFYGEIVRVLRPGGKLVFHDIFQGPNGDPHYPTPWASEPSISFLATPVSVQKTLSSVGLKFEQWDDMSRLSADWFAGVYQKLLTTGVPPLGLHLLMGETALEKLNNVGRNLQEGRIVVVQGVAVKEA